MKKQIKIVAPCAKCASSSGYYNTIAGLACWECDEVVSSVK
jgi:hypothetical protein